MRCQNVARDAHIRAFCKSFEPFRCPPLSHISSSRICPTMRRIKYFNTYKVANKYIDDLIYSKRYHITAHIHVHLPFKCFTVLCSIVRLQTTHVVGYVLLLLSRNYRPTIQHTSHHSKTACRVR